MNDHRSAFTILTSARRGDTVGSCSPAPACSWQWGLSACGRPMAGGNQKLGCTAGHRSIVLPGLHVHKNRGRLGDGSLILFGTTFNLIYSAFIYFSGIRWGVTLIFSDAEITLSRDRKQTKKKQDGIKKKKNRTDNKNSSFKLKQCRLFHMSKKRLKAVFPILESTQGRWITIQSWERVW